MSLFPSTIIRQAYIRIGGWQGNSQEINAQYNADQDLEQIVSESFPAQSMYDMLTGVESEMAMAVSMNEDNTLRSTLQDLVTVTSGDRIPVNADSGAKIIGVLGQVRQLSTGIDLTPALHEDEIRTIVNGPTGLFKSSYYSYALRPPRIYATVTDLVIDCCSFDYTARAAAINANGALLFPESQNAYLDGLLSSLQNQDPAYTALANEYRAPYQTWLSAQAPNRNVVSEAAA